MYGYGYTRGCWSGTRRWTRVNMVRIVIKKDRHICLVRVDYDGVCRLCHFVSPHSLFHLSLDSFGRSFQVRHERCASPRPDCHLSSKRQTDHEMIAKRQIIGTYKRELIVGEHQGQKWSLFPVGQGAEICLGGCGRHVSVYGIGSQL